MKRKLLEVLADPVTGEPLELADDAGAEDIETGELVAPHGARYPIRRGIPRFVDESYSASFGLQWNRFSKVQLDSANGGSYSRARFDAETGWGRQELAGKWVVDAGCGAGRFAEVAASYGGEVIAVDLSSAVDAAGANLRSFANVHVIQANLMHLPLRPERVDYLYSIGVLQHTPDPLASARSLVGFLAAGARFTFTIYGRKRWTPLYGKYLVRPLTRRLPPEVLLRSVERAMPALFPLTSALYPLPVVGKVVQFVLPVANYPQQTDLSRQVRYDQAVLDTFDMLSPRFDRPITAEELTGAIGDLAPDLTFVSRVPVIARGARRVTDNEPVGARP